MASKSHALLLRAESGSLDALISTSSDSSMTGSERGVAAKGVVTEVCWL